MTHPQLPPPSPHDYTPPGVYQAPPGAYAAPVGGYGSPVSGAGGINGYQPPRTAPARSPLMGIMAAVLSAIAIVVAPVLAGVAGYQIGFGLPSVMTDVDSVTADLSFLSPVRDQVLWGEIGFWGGTLAGIAAIVLGIIAIAQRKGRGWGITGLVLSVIAPTLFFLALVFALSIGAADSAVAAYAAYAA